MHNQGCLGNSAGQTLARSAPERQAYFEWMIEQRGMRAQLRSGNLLTGQLFVAFDFFPDAPQVKIDWSREPTELPAAPSTVTDLQAKLTSIVAKLDKLPYEAIGDDVAKALSSLDQTLQGVTRAANRLDTDVFPELKATLEEARLAIASANTVLRNTDATLLGKDAPGQQELRDALQEITRAARSLRLLGDYLERHPEALIWGKTTEKP